MTEFQITYLIGGVAGLLVGAAITLLVSRSRSKAALTTMARLEEMEKAALEEKLASVRQQLETVRTDLTAVEGRLDKRRDAMAELEAQKAALAQTATRIPVLEDALEKSRNGQEQLNAVNLALEKKLSELSTRLDAERRQAQEKIALLNDARERLTNEFKVLAERILEEKGKTFADHNKAQMDGLIGPLREQLGDFKKRVEDVYDKESRDRVALVNEINHLKNLNERIGKDALNLTNALKGDVKTLGGWGEVILERILEASGLEKGRAYETQVSLAGASGSRYQPDVIVRLPEGRDVIVDAKVSLKAYERYHASADETVRATAIKEHLASLRTHLKGLSEKHYEDLEGIRTLDFVLMFVPIEGAFFAAVEHDRSLFTEAFEKNVILVSPSTLLVTLRTIHNIWRYADQNENALEIARQAGGLYDKFIGFIEALEEVGRQLDRAKEAYRGRESQQGASGVLCG
ncbi:MAG: DNA recombination protein RmuC [Desulfosarcina sp.]|nr:DNA recombination protein RmuC [Desulfosarcina sp.]MBC2767234.1 DNA recombination protein RmuC [Desulfosarcina sp.]